MEGLNFNNILGEQDIETLFSSPEETADEAKDEEDTSPESPEKNGDKEDNKDNTATEVTNPEELFEDTEEKQPESVGSGKEDVKGAEDTSTDDDSGASPNQNFYSSIANAMAVDGIFPNLTDDDIKKANDAESFSDLLEAEVNARLDERQRRVAQALDNHIEPDDIRRYENTLSYINSITDTMLAAEDEKGETIRRNLIYQDFINRGYTAEKATKLTNRSIDNGNDIEDAKDALQNNREYFSGRYNQLLKDAEDEENARKAERAKKAESLKKSMLNDKQLMGDIELSSSVRKKAYDSITKPVYRDPDTGDYYTALQRYESEHPLDFMKYVGLVYSLTDGFKDFESFTKGKVKKEVRKGLRELEHTLNNTSRNADGSLKLVTNTKNDPNAFIDSNFTIAL